MLETDKTIWVLGGHASNADRNIPWQVDIPNLSNPDILIIDLNTIPEALRGDIPYYEIRDYIRYILMAGKVVFIILSTDFRNYYKTLPVYPKVEKIKPCDFYDVNPLRLEIIPEEIIEYSKYVDNCDFFIDYLDKNALWDMLRPNTDWKVEKYPFTPHISHISEDLLFKLMNVAKQSIGLSAKYIIRDSYGDVLHITGSIHFLPPPTKISSSEGIEVIVNTIVGEEFKEEEPDWISNVEVPGAKELDIQITGIKNIIAEKIEEMNKLIEDKEELDKYLKLLWAFGKPLENAVKDAFYFLGFTEIHEGRSKELEDWVIDIQTSEEYVHGVMEVKGKEKRSSLSDINQCFRWVNEYRVQEGKKVKGIFLPNQFRRTEPLDSSKRLHFETNEIDFAKDFNICILPTSELFKAVRYVLEENTLSREDIESKMLDAEPICILVS